MLYSLLYEYIIKGKGMTVTGTLCSYQTGFVSRYFTCIRDLFLAFIGSSQIYFINTIRLQKTDSMSLDCSLQYATNVITYI